ncbi:motile sperm domain-containing protein 2 [Centrocercus urophasianus]|uniref:motile sperm domain-containing protein 2 n=1 Tax=Centrocercus urophasianus TaxID=9002 RepID=UPI001C649F67|nr:motile sperm domain-containing protein 2 [Centrocercus urophasianus]
MTLRGGATERPTPAAGMGVWSRPLPIGHASRVTRRLHRLFFLSPCSCRGRHGRPRRTMADQQDKAALIAETRRRFEAEYLPDKSDKYDSRDVERLQQDDKWVENYLIWRHDVVDDTLKMIDESFQWRKEYAVNDLTESVLPKWLFESGALFLHGYDKEGYKLFWFKVKLHVRDQKQQLDKKKLVAFWLEHYAKRDHGKPLTVVFDMAETGISHIDLDFVRFIVNCFTDYYPNFLTKIVIFEMPWIMNGKSVGLFSPKIVT